MRSRRLVDTVLGVGDEARTALTERGHEITFGALRERINDRVDELALPRRSLVVLHGDTSAELVVTYLALLQDDHVPLLASAHADSLAASWQADAVVGAHATGVEIDRRAAPARELHPDLALLLSTSGSTGSPKLVRLSHENISANAASIAEFLELTEHDRGVTTLPLHYCYGLSVLHSHLAVGASVALTTASVVDPCFAGALDGVTNVAGVPYTFELLERVGPDRLRTPSLRLVTQAGGRLAPADVRRWAARTESWGASFCVMYGQTEATARMAYLPQHLLARRPGAIGVAVPGGRFELEPVAGHPADVGELVYHGPNVMMGYARTAGDLTLGPTIDALRTGDLARFHADDEVYEIVGRRARFVKPFGLRIDLDEVQASVRTHVATTPTEVEADVEVAVAVAGDDRRIVVVVPVGDADAIRGHVRALTGLPDASIVVDTAGPLPRTASGKVDYAAILDAHPNAPADVGPPAPADSSPVAGVFQTVLGRPVDATSTFVSLGGDSMSYVECSIRLESALGHLPTDWHLRTVADLERTAGRRGLPRLDLTVLMRALGICLIVSTHMHVFYFSGGAHMMLAVVGFNFSRFQLPIARARDRLVAGLRTASRAAIPVALWVGLGMLLAGGYSVGTLLLINNYLGPPNHQHGRWHFWFVEVFVQLTIGATLLMAIPLIRRIERRIPYGFVLGVLALCLVMRWVPDSDIRFLRFRTHGVAFFFVLGWLAHRSVAVWQRLLTSVLCIATIAGAFSVPDFFARQERGWFVALSIVALVWVREIPMPRAVMRPIAVIAAASMWILITHFTVWPPLERTFGREWGYVLTITTGIGTWALVEQVTRLARRRRSAGARRPGQPTLAAVIH